MDAIKVAKVEGVTCRKGNDIDTGTLHLTAHHLIFHYDSEKDEMWTPYPIINLVTRLPQSLRGDSPVTFHCRTFTTFTLAFKKDSDAADVFESVKGLTVATSVTQLYAFFYVPNPPVPTSNGWSIYSPREEFGRMGVGTRTKAWRFTDINKDYQFCPTYPARLVVPTRISDTTLQYASKYRSKCRIPALAYLHWANFGTITRSSQPLVGITNNRSIQDEKLIEAIFQSHLSPDSRVPSIAVYGATATNLIIDARPTTNAMANVAKGAGTENMDHYKDGKKAYLGVDNIHVMRDSLNKVVEALREADAIAASMRPDTLDDTAVSGGAYLDRQALRRSGWLRHISAILDGTLLIIRNVHVNSSHVLIHCSDGWDRTAQLSSLSQLCLDPFYRTMRGFQILIEKDWLSFGHKFLDRSGHLSSEKFFISPADGSGSAATPFLASVQNKLGGQTHLKETSPVFHQFLECVRQIQRQFPERFEFNERYLSQLFYHTYSCQFGTFLFNNERERRIGEGGPPPCERTASVWDFFNSPDESEKNKNPDYDSSLDDPSRRDGKVDMGVLIPNPKDVRFWYQLYGRTDEEMNGRMVTGQAQGVDMIGPVESAQDDPITSPSSSNPALLPLPPSPGPSSLSVTPSPGPQPVHGSPSRRPRTPLSPTSPPPQGSLLTTDALARPVPIRPEGQRQDSLYSLQGSRQSAISAAPSTSSPWDSSPSRPRLQSKEVFSAASVKSMWGKFSSNASAALSAVQDAYGDITRDMRGLSAGEEGPRLSEMESRDRGADADWATSTLSSSLPASSLVQSPGAGLRTSSTSTMPRSSALTMENPWGTNRTGSRTPPKKVDDIFSTSNLWLDDPPQANTTPVASAPVSLQVDDPMSQRAAATPSTQQVAEPKETDSASASASSSKDIDPLGVGVW